MFTVPCRALALLMLSAGIAAVIAAPPLHAAEPATAPATALPSEMPASFVPRVASFDFTRREVMIPMRDGVKLKTVILVPAGARRAPILLSRTPYGASQREARNSSAHLSAVIDSTDVADDAVVNGGYIRVVQDVRGKYGSEGDYVMTRPLQGPLNPTAVDHATDTYDTIDWLVKNVPETNGKVGILGISYDGFTSLMALVHPHPALRAAIPINAMADGWMGDDWFHKGAFRQDSLVYAHDQEAARDSGIPWWSDHYDDYDTWLAAGSAGAMAHLHGLEQVGFAAKLMQHPAYDEFWQDQAVDKILARQGVTVPVMLVHSLWDQEDIYGNIAVYKALHAQTTPNLYLVLGPWYHHQERLDGSRVGAIEFGSDTAAYFRRQLLQPFLDHFLKDEAPPLALAPVTAYETGTNRWVSLPEWPRGCATGCPIETRKLYLQANGGLSFAAAGPAASESYVSDPAKPVPYLPRPVHIGGEAGQSSWQTWLVSDQRDVASRPDVLSFSTAVLTAPLKISGEPTANLIASTTGTDGDFIVKLIDVYPDEMGREPKMGGYQLMVAADILRGRYRDSFSNPRAVPANKPETFRFSLPTANHVFLPGHRIMVQVQSTLFPLYDRNPQTYVPNIFFAQPGDYRKATIKIFEGGKDASFVEVPVVGM